MSDYNYNYNNQQDPNNNNNGANYTGFSTDSTEAPKKQKKHTGLKTAALIMAMALVSAGSIGAYRYFAGESFTGGSLVEELEDDAESSTKEATKELLASKAVSLIKTEDVGGNVLSNEEIVEKVLPSVVGIESSFTTEQTIGNDFSDFEDFFDFGFGFGNGFGGGSGRNSEPVTREYKGTGTGVIISDNGYIVTNAHVIYDSEYGGGEASSVSVVLDNDKTYDAEVIGYDTDCDLAVLKIDETGLTAAEFGNSDELRLGESVIAIGNPLGFELMDTVTGGMISGLNRNITINNKAMNLIQTDAAINSGNSGGPLINKYGQVIGINSSKMSSSYSSSGASIEGIGFAIPSNETASIIDDLMKYGYVTGKPQLGISAQNVSEATAKMYDWPVGIYIYSVNKDSAAEKAGLRKGDIIVKVDDKKVTTSDELIAQLNTHSAGDEIEITFVRDEEEKTVKVTLDEKVVEEQSKEEETTKSKSKKNSKTEEEIDEQDDAEEEEEDEKQSAKKSKADKAEKAEKNDKADKSDEAEDEE